MQILLVALGGAMGASLRYGVSRLVLSKLTDMELIVAAPLATGAVNALGCLMIGVVFGVLEHISDPGTYVAVRNLLIIGLLGGFTTFSSFSLETLLLLQSGLWQKALLNIIGSVLVCLAGTAAGLYLVGIFYR